MKIPHADLIHAWADGAEIEVKGLSGEWKVTDEPIFSIHSQYRIKPKKTVIRYKRYLTRWVSGILTVECMQKDIFAVPDLGNFVRWIDTDWQEYEVEE